MTEQQEAAMRQAFKFVMAIHPAFICEAMNHTKEQRHTSLEPCPHVATQQQVAEALRQALESHVNETPKSEHEQQPADERALFDCGTYVGSHIGREIKHNIDGPQPAAKSRNEWADSKTHFRSVFQEWLRDKNGGNA